MIRDHLVRELECLPKQAARIAPVHLLASLPNIRDPYYRLTVEMVDFEREELF